MYCVVYGGLGSTEHCVHNVYCVVYGGLGSTEHCVHNVYCVVYSGLGSTEHCVQLCVLTIIGCNECTWYMLWRFSKWLDFPV